MKLSKEHIERLREMLARAGQRIVIVSHTNPDGDAVGSSLAWAEILRTMGHEVTCVVPNKFPYFLDWMPGLDEVVVFKTDTEGRARLFGYAINRKMEVIQDGTVAYMSLMENEMRRFQFQQGDSEGFVNYALTIKKVKMSAMFLAHRKFIRVSLRSRGGVDVNLFARKYFGGGGHRNAAGGKSFVSMQETIDHYIRSVKEFAAEGHLG